MEQTKKFIALDVGAESGRCIVAALEDRKVEMHEVHRFVTRSIRSEDGFYWDIAAIREEILSGLSKAREAYGPSFDGIGVDTWGVDYVLIDEDGRSLSYPYHYRDDRTIGIMEQAFKIVPRGKLYATTGIQFARINTLFQLLAEKKSKISRLNSARTLLMIPDYLNYILSGVEKAEFSIASTTGLAGANERTWSRELIDAFGFPWDIFPGNVEPGTILERILPSISDRTGLDRNVPIIATTGHDTASAVVSVPEYEGGWAFLSSGTWSLIGIETKKPILTPEAMDCNFTNEGGFAGTTRFLKNIIGLWPLQECLRVWNERSAKYTYSDVSTLAAEYKHAGAWVDLADEGFLKTSEMPDTITAMLKKTGQSTNEGVGFITRVILESLAFGYRAALKELESASGQRIDRLHAVGGGIQNELLMQLTADAIARPVVAGPIEGTAVGNIGVQAISVGAVPNLRAWRETVGRSFGLKVYEPKNSAYFDDHERNYNKIVTQNSDQKGY